MFDWLIKKLKKVKVESDTAEDTTPEPKSYMKSNKYELVKFRDGDYGIRLKGTRYKQRGPEYLDLVSSSYYTWTLTSSYFKNCKGPKNEVVKKFCSITDEGQKVDLEDECS